MQLYFLAAADNTPLTKTFASNFGVITKSSYPNVRDFNSFDAEVSSPLEFYAAITTHALSHHCLVKGHLTRQLQCESRQGATNANDTTSWICFDIDHLPGVNDAETFIAALPAEFHDASYVLQLSSSSQIDGTSELRAHLFFMLAEAVMAPTLKVWMKNLNLQQPAFEQHLRLAEGGCTLKWPVDISVNQNDKLIYIAPPICVGFEDPVSITDRIRLITKGQAAVRLNLNGLNAEAVRTKELKKVNALRDANGLERKKLRFEHMDGLTVIKNADQMMLTAAPFEERGFIYFPIGSNRHTYYHPLGRHEFLHSFKDPETVYPMKIVLPSYYWECERRIAKENNQERQILAFRDMRSDIKYIGEYTNDLRFATFNQIRAREDIDDFYTQHKQRTPDLIPTWNYEFDPTRMTRIDPDKQWLNKFIPTAYMELIPSGQTVIPPRIERLLKHIMNYDADCFEHFTNWLAFKFQTRTKCKTAWFFQGIEGTGKGVLYNKVLRLLFGADYCHLKRMDNLLDKFNAELETSLLWVIDEANIEDFRDDGQIIEKLKNLIVEDQQVVRAMRMNAYNATNYTDVILFSNRSLAIKISESDRRYNIAPRQNEPLLRVMSREEINTLEEELPQFADYLLSKEIDVGKAQTPLDNDAKNELIALSRNTHDDFLHHLTTGNLLYILRNANDSVGLFGSRNRDTAINILKQWAYDSIHTPNTTLTMDDIRHVYAFIVNGKEPVPTPKIARMLQLRGANLITHDEETPRLSVHWRVNEVAVQRWLQAQNNLSSPNARGIHGQQNSPPTH